MSSNIEIQRICQYCSKEFTARTTVTKYCTMKCTKAVWRNKTRNANIERNNEQVRIIKSVPIEELKAKEFLTVKETATLLNCSRKTVNRAINLGRLTAVNIGIKTTRIKRTDIETLQIFREVEDESQTREHYNISECCTIGEAHTRFNISPSGLRNILIKHKVPKFQKHKFVYIPITILEKLLK